MTEFEQPVAKVLADKIGLSALKGRDGRNYKLVVTKLDPIRPRTGWYHLNVDICDQNGKPSQTPLTRGIVSGGGRSVMPWFEVRLYPVVTMADGTTLDARGEGLETAIVNLLGTLVAPGGHLMIEYESVGQSETHAALLLRVPPAATHLGSLMLRAGFRGAFKDWYIAEGGHEGPRKLQANKSPTPAAARAAMRDHIGELRTFLKQPLAERSDDAGVIRRAQSRARDLLKEFAK